MADERDQPPGLVPPLRDWTLPQLVAGLAIALVCLAPWFVLYLIVWALLSTP